MVGMIAVIFLRLISPLVLVRFSLLGALLMIPIDYFDMNLLGVLGYHDLAIYQELDKTLDLYYLCFECYIAFFWQNKLARKIALSLFLYRLVGFILFSITQYQFLLVIFPNVFEWFYISYLAYKKIFQNSLSARAILYVVIFLTILKLIHEYLLHINTTHPWTENRYIKPAKELILSN